MEIHRVSTGLYAIDREIEGGIPKGSIISIYGTTDRLKKKIQFSFLDRGIALVEPILCITTRDSLQDITRQAKQFSIDLSQVIYLDAVHWRIKRVNPKLKTDAKYEVSNLTDLNALLAKIMEACNKNDVSRILFDSPSSLLLYSTPGKEQVYKFFELLTAFLRSNNISMYYTLEHNAHPENVVATMHYLSDGVIRTTASYLDNNQVEISQLILTDYPTHPIDITANDPSE